MIQRIGIHGFRSCRNVVLNDLGGLTALVGRNAAGKTAVLKAIEWAARAATGPAFSQPDLVSSINGPVSVSLELVLDGRRFRYRATQSAQGPRSERGSSVKVVVSETISREAENSGWERILDRRRGRVRVAEAGKTRALNIAQDSSALFALSSILPRKSLVLEQLEPLTVFLRATRYYPLDELSESTEPEFLKDSDYRDWRARLEATGEAGSSVSMRLLHLWSGDPRFGELMDLLGEGGLGIIDAIDVAPLGTGNGAGEGPHGHASARVVGPRPVLYRILYRPSRRAGGDGASVPHAMLSHGTRRLLRIATCLVFDRSSLMLIEHPEDGVHFGLARKLIHLLRSRSERAQTILSSHSPDVLDVLRPDEVRLVTMEGGATSARALSAKERRIASEYIKEEGTLSDFLRLAAEV